MKTNSTKLITIAVLLLVLTLLLTQNDKRITDALLGIINPIKQHYKHFTQELEDKSSSYLFQQESIEKLSRENRILRTRLLEQTHYIKQVKDIYTTLPDLSRLPIHSISIAQTISYVKLNSFSQIILTKPKALKEDKLYGLIQGSVVAGVAQVHSDQLYGYLTSDNSCRFAVFVGEEHAPGIAIGAGENRMIIKFIPKWHKIEVGDKVITSGLDAIFFAHIPVGVVSKVEVQSSYKIAYIQTHSDIFHPKTFFLINDAKATLTQNFDSNRTQLTAQHASSIPSTKESNLTVILPPEANQTLPAVSSIPSRIDQTQETTIEPTPPPPESITLPKKPKPTPKPPKRRRVQPTGLDLF